MSERFNIIVLAVASVLFLASTLAWHSFSSTPSFTELSLHSWDSMVPLNENACFTFTAKTHPTNTPLTLSVLSNKAPLFSKSLPVHSMCELITECISSSALIEGENRIQLQANSQELVFHVRAIPNRSGKETQTVNVPLSNSAPFPNVLLLVLFLLVFFASIYFFTSYFSLPSSILLTLILTYAYSIAFVLISQFLHVYLNFFLAWLGYLLVLAIVIWFFHKTQKPQFSGEPRSLHDFTKVSLVFLFLFIVFQLLSSSHFTNWNVYYERQTELLLNSPSIPLQDPLSYLGRAWTFVPGYFFLEGTLSILTQSSVSFTFYLMLLLSNLALLAALFEFARVRKLSLYSIALLISILFALMFVFNISVVSPRHTFAFALLIYALTLLLERKHPVYCALIIALMTFVQIPTLIWLALAYVILSRSSIISLISIHSLISFAGGSLIFLGLYAPTLLVHGLPFEALPAQWGYLLALPVQWFLDDFNLLPVLVLAGLIALSVILFTKLSSDLKKSFAGLLLLLILQFIFSFRYNLIFQLVFAVYLIEFLDQIVFVRFLSFFSKPFLVFPSREQCLHVILLLVFVLAIANNAVREQSIFVLNSQDISALTFVSALPENARVLSDPYYGHAVAYFGQRTVLADLYVEYAIPEQLNATYDFLVNGNSFPLSEYSLNAVFVPVYGTQTAAGQFVPINKTPLQALTKVYANGELEVYIV